MEINTIKLLQQQKKIAGKFVKHEIFTQFFFFDLLNEKTTIMQWSRVKLMTMNVLGKFMARILPILYIAII